MLLQPEDDAATVHMGSDWRMPTKVDFEELINNTTFTLVDLQDNEYPIYDPYKAYNNLKCIKCTGSNGNSISFYPNGYDSPNFYMSWLNSLTGSSYNVAYYAYITNVGISYDSDDGAVGRTELG